MVSCSNPQRLCPKGVGTFVSSYLRAKMKVRLIVNLFYFLFRAFGVDMAYWLAAAAMAATMAPAAVVAGGCDRQFNYSTGSVLGFRFADPASGLLHHPWITTYERWFAGVHI